MRYYKGKSDGSKGLKLSLIGFSLVAFLAFQLARQGIIAADESDGHSSLLRFAEEAQVSPSLRGMEDSSGQQTDYTHQMQNEKTTEYARHESPPSLFSQVAPLFFPIDAATGLIAFPLEVKTVIFDIGARESDYLRALELRKDPSVALILIDPLPASMIPIEKRAAEYALNEVGPPPRGDLSPKFTNRVFTIGAAMGEEEGVVDFNIGMGPACSSLLDKTNTTGFWCVGSAGKIRVNKFMLKSVLELIPKTIEAIHLKVDAEGADHLVLRGAGAAIHRLKTIVIECQDLPADDPSRNFQNSCVYEEVKEYMCKNQGICKAHKKGQNRGVNVFFLPSNEDKVAIPDILKSAKITYRHWYREVAQE